MKALSVRQPYILAIVTGVKTVELRSRPTKHRGELLICSTKGGDDAYLRDDENYYYKIAKGAHMCVVDVVDCRKATPADAEAAFVHEDEITEDMWAWEFKLKKLVASTPVVGKLNLFEVDDALIKDGEVEYFHKQFEKTKKEPKSGFICPC